MYYIFAYHITIKNNSSQTVQLKERNWNIYDSLQKTEIDAFYYCPYHPSFDSEEKCKCRKPSPQMVFKAADDFQIDLKKSFFMGDKSSDILCGQNAGLKTILLKIETLIFLKNIFKILEIFLIAIFEYNFLFCRILDFQYI